MAKLTYATCSLLAVAGLTTSCRNQPSTYEDCILEALAGSSKSDRAVQLIETACQEKFPEISRDPILPEFPTGSFYFLSEDTPSCHEIGVSTSGTLVTGKHGFCDSGSPFEQSASGALTLSCLNFNQLGSIVVFDVEWIGEHLSLTSDEWESVLFSSLAACERTISSEERESFEREVEAAESAAEQRRLETLRREEAIRQAKAAARERRELELLNACCECLTKTTCLYWDESDSGSISLCRERVKEKDYTFISFGCMKKKCGSTCSVLPQEWVDGFLG